MPPKKPRADEKPSERRARDILRALEKLVEELGCTIERRKRRKPRGATQTRHKKKFLN